MISRDYLLRQIQQAIQVLAQVLLQKQDGDPAGAYAALAEGIEAVTGVTLERLRQRPLADILDAASDEGTFSPEKAAALAQLLAEDDAPASRVRARWLYEAVLASGGPVPLDIRERIAALPAHEPGTRGA
ncbi:hypothetical protein [Rubricoccus marinus]|uniref:Uncharacterized protein n=1 Tax=Rubricoccus marinus TaxID=716817 RepID=A0A259TW13_9BACT|nr:hypothetical protein [Rubricoccus marinus]OZC01817.1 hypothetical protein BSZ36_01725 [Rubricoccus marinus]